MSIFNVPITDLVEEKNWDPKAGMHNAMCVGACYAPNQEVTYEGETKVQNLLSLCFAVNDDGEMKTIITKKYNFSFNKNSALTKMIAAWGVNIKSPGDFIGQIAGLVIVKSGDYKNINSIIATETAPELDMSEVFIPKFWLTDKSDAETGFTVVTLEGMTVRPPKEA